MPNWEVLSVKEKEIRGGTGNAYRPKGTYLISRKKPSEYEINNFRPMKVRSKTGIQIGWILPTDDWILRLLLGVELKPKKPAKNDLEWWMLNKVFEKYKDNLRPYQEKFINYAKDTIMEDGCIRKTLISGLGSGKTLMSSTVMNMKENGVNIVVAPRYLHDSWRAECKKWGFPEPIITTYESTHKYHYLEEIDTIILDEMLRVKNPEAQRTKNTKILCDIATNVIAMSGTPTSSKQAADLRHINVCNHGAVPDHEEIWKYQFGINPRYELAWGGRNLLEIDGWKENDISKFISPYVYTVDQREIEKNQPDFQFHRIKLEQPNQWEFFREGFYTESESGSKSIAQCRQLCSGFWANDEKEVTEHNTIKLKWIKSFLEDNPNTPVIIFSTFIHSQKSLFNKLKDYQPAAIFAGMESGEAVKRFMSGETKVLIVSSQLGEGLNIHEVCGTIIFESNGLSPTMRQQAIGRVVREGAKYKANIYDLLCEDTLDWRLLNILENNIGFSENQVTNLLKEEW